MLRSMWDISHWGNLTTLVSRGSLSDPRLNLPNLYIEDVLEANVASAVIVAIALATRGSLMGRHHSASIPLAVGAIGVNGDSHLSFLSILAARGSPPFSAFICSGEFYSALPLVR